jgi:hypothetical protein
MQGSSWPTRFGQFTKISLSVQQSLSDIFMVHGDKAPVYLRQTLEPSCR